MSLLGALFLDLVRAFFRVHAIAGELAHSWIQEIGASLGRKLVLSKLRPAATAQIALTGGSLIGSALYASHDRRRSSRYGVSFGGAERRLGRCTGRVLASAQGNPTFVDVLDVIADRTRLDLTASSQLSVCHYRTGKLVTLRGPLRASVLTSGITGENGISVDNGFQARVHDATVEDRENRCRTSPHGRPSMCRFNRASRWSIGSVASLSGTGCARRF
jgi:hypothetical protein